MSEPEKKKFLDLVSKSELLTPKRLASWNRSAQAGSFSAKQLAQDLVNKRLVTLWQAKMLLKGVHRLMLGNYVLRDRVDKSELGDRFDGVHKQLSREVSIQYLPAKFCESAALKKRVFGFASKLMKLDHPSLIHVLDADEENGRIYLVAEAISGSKMSDEVVDELNSLQRAVIVGDLLKAILHVHEQGVVHSSIDSSNVVLDDSKNARLIGLTRFAILNALSDSPATADGDIADFIALADHLVFAGKYGSKDNEQIRNKLSEAISIAKQDPHKSLDEILRCQQLIADREPALPEKKNANVDTPDETVVPGEKTSSSVGQQRRFESHSSTARSIAASRKQRKTGLIDRLARRHPVLLLSCCVLLSAALICSSVVAARSLVATPAVTKKSIEAEKDRSDAFVESNDVDRIAEPIDVETVVGNELANSVETDQPSVDDIEKSETDIAPVPKVGSMTDPAVNKAAIAAIFQKDIARRPQETSENLPDTKQGVESATSIPVQMVTLAPSEPVSETSMEPTNGQPDSSASESVKYLNPGADPFKGFATSVDLMAIEKTEPISFGNLILEKNHLLGAEVLCTESVHRSKPIFELTRSDDNRQAWDFVFRKKRKSPPVSIAKLIKKPNELFFQWTEKAREIKVAGFLRNCRIKLSTPANSHWLSLRKPIQIEDFKFTDSGTVIKEVDIPDLPILASLSASAAVIKVKANSTSRKYGSLMYPAEIATGFPARMFFEDDVDRFMSIDIAAEVRNRLKLQAALVLQPLPNEPGFALDPTQVQKAMARVREMAIIAQQDSERAKAAKLSTEERKVFSDAAKALKGRAELTDYYEHIVPQLVQKDIPVTVTFALNEQHRVVLAQTVAPGDEN